MTKAALWIAESFNEYAEIEDRDELVPGHRPGSPMFWFNGLARECGSAYLKDSGLRALLTPSAVRKLKKVAA